MGSTTRVTFWRTEFFFGFKGIKIRFVSLLASSLVCKHTDRQMDRQTY